MKRCTYTNRYIKTMQCEYFYLLYSIKVLNEKNEVKSSNNYFAAVINVLFIRPDIKPRKTLHIK